MKYKYNYEINWQFLIILTVIGNINGINLIQALYFYFLGNTFFY